MRVKISIEMEGEAFEVVLSKDDIAARTPDGRLNLYRLGCTWEKARDDAQTWVNARTGRKDA